MEESKKEGEIEILKEKWNRQKKVGKEKEDEEDVKEVQYNVIQKWNLPHSSEHRIYLKMHLVFYSK